MKKRILTLLLTMIMLATTLVVSAAAAEVNRFSDVKDRNTETAVETLRLMGVLDGYGDGTFRPDGILTRAQFCKMAAYITDSEAELGRYRTITVFPDVKPSHWAISYINLAAKGKGIIAGYPDGTFQPNRTLTMGHAVTILLRLLDYKDEEVGGVWPDSYMAVADMIGLTDGLPTNGNAPLTRAQAAKLFMNLLDTEKKSGGTLYTLSKETELRAVDGGTGKLKTADATYDMVHPVSSTSLVGARGYAVLNASGKALTFLPIISGNGGTASVAIVLSADHSTAGFSELAGSNTYALYKNGLPITSADLRKNDVASYYPATNSIRVCDTRVSVYYESCEPSPSAPARLKVLGGTEFSVLPSAMASLAEFKPGQQMTLLLTADGQVAAAVSNKSTSSTRGNAVGLVEDDGTIQLLCGSTMIPLAIKADAEYSGQVVRISSSQKNTVNLSVLSGSVSGSLNIAEKTLGGKKLTDNAMIFDFGQQISLSDLTSGVISASDITYARVNWAGEIDLVVLHVGTGGNVLYGWAAVRKTTVGTDTITTVEIISGNKRTGEIETAYGIDRSGYVEATMKDGKFMKIQSLSCLKNVSNDVWVGSNLVVHAGRSYTLAKDLLCFNADSGEWITLEQAQAYSDSADLYVKDGVVRIIEVSHSN